MKTPARPRVKRVVAVVTGLILISAAAVFLQAWIGAGRRIAAEEASVRRRVDELRSRSAAVPNLFEPPEEGNGWEYFQESIKELETIDSFDMDVFPTLAGDEIPKIDDEAIALMHQRVLPAIAHLRRAAQCLTWDLQRTYEASDEFMSGTGSLIKWNRILSDLASHEHRAQEDRAALELVALGLWLGQAGVGKGGMYDEMICSVLNSIQLSTLKDFMAGHGAEWETWDWFKGALDKIRTARPAYIQMVRRDDLWYRQVILRGDRENWTTNDWPYTALDGVWKHLPIRLKTVRLLRYQDEIMGVHEQIAKLPIWDAARVAAECMKDRPNKLLSALVGDTASEYVSRSWGNRCLDECKWALAEVSVAVAQFHAKEGRYPLSLRELDLARSPIDPLTGKQLGYVNRGTSALVFSMGHDLDDDGGRPISDDDLAEDGDIVWTIKRRP